MYKRISNTFFSVFMILFTLSVMGQEVVISKDSLTNRKIKTFENEDFNLVFPKLWDIDDKGQFTEDALIKIVPRSSLNYLNYFIIYKDSMRKRSFKSKINEIYNKAKKSNGPDSVTLIEEAPDYYYMKVSTGPKLVKKFGFSHSQEFYHYYIYHRGNMYSLIMVLNNEEKDIKKFSPDMELILEYFTFKNPDRPLKPHPIP